MLEIREWHIVISGFQQKSGTINGTVRIWDALRRITASRRDAVVEQHSWNADFADLAERIVKLQPMDGRPVVNIYGYSWGGMSAANFAAELRRRGVNVNHMVLSDAVYRHWYWLGWWRAFAPWRSIVIPDNVRQVTAFVQRQSWPRGHRITPANAKRTKMEKPVVLVFDHCWMDDASQFQAACVAAAKSVTT